MWRQTRFSLPPFPRGCHLVTRQVLQHIEGDLRHFDVGLCHIFIQHTSASLTINENADPDVRVDMETVLNRLVPEAGPYRHTDEGPDDLPAHAKASLMGASVTVPITAGKLSLGTWQGIYLCEHRDAGGARTLVVTLQGVGKEGAATGGTGGAGGGGR